MEDKSTIMDIIKNNLELWFEGHGVSEQLSKYVVNGTILILIIAMAFIVNYLVKKILLRVVSAYAKRSKNKWDDILIKRRVFDRFPHITAAVVVLIFVGVVPEYREWIERITYSYIVLIGMMVVNSFLDALNDIYQGFKVSKTRPIKSFIQVVKIFVFIVGIILVISTLVGKSPWILLSGIGAATAVTSLVFKDSILGLVGGIQLAANDMLRVGDWIEMPKYGADGDVIEITLNTVKVRNFDKTITTIPTYALISDSFKNWRGMKESGGRRIKRSVNIDVTSIKFCSQEMLERFKKIQYITEYIENKVKEIEAYNKERKIDVSEIVNGRHLTNIGTFRAYLQAYLKNHPRIHEGMTLMVRQLPPQEHGLPIEIYVFTDTTDWIEYEGIQSDIFDHILAAVPEFELKVFQEPTGHDFQLGLGNTGKVKEIT